VVKAEEESDAAGGHSDSAELDTRAYLEQVRREIDDEVRARRAAGDFPPSFERKLDELFARFTPTGTADDHFTEALKLADRSAYFDIDVPTGSRRTSRGLVKWSLWQAEAWFVRYVVTQLNHFAASSMRVLHLLDERLSEMEREMESLTPPPLPEEELVPPGADVGVFSEFIVTRFASNGKPKGRILHAECGDGAFLKTLREAQLDSYGIDPGTKGADMAVQAGLDVRRDDVIGHLGSVASEALGGLVLSGCVDRMSLSERRRLIQLAELKLVQGGTLAVVGTAPEAWEPSVGPVVADLAPGRPLHLETWAYLLGQSGFTDIAAHTGPQVPGGTHEAPRSFLVLATKRVRQFDLADAPGRTQGSSLDSGSN
jgi:hypothetical protein